MQSFRRLRGCFNFGYVRSIGQLTCKMGLFESMLTIHCGHLKYRSKHSCPVVLPQADAKVLHVHGQIIQDNFSWLQDFKCSQVKKLLKSENRFTNQVMNDTGLLQTTLMKKFEHLAKATRYFAEDALPVSFGGFLYYTKTSNNHLVHCRSRENGIDEEILFDEANAASYWEYFEVKAMKLSPTQKFVAFVVDTSGKDDYQGILIDTVNKPGQILEHFPCVNLEWSGNDNMVYYTTFDKIHRADKVWRHEIGQDCSMDELIFEENDARFFVDVSCTKDRRFVTINSSSKTTSEVYILDSGNSKASAELVRARESCIEYYVEHCHDVFYILTNYPDGGNYKVMSAHKKDLCRTKWKSVIQNSDEVILDDMDIFSNYCVLYVKESLAPRLTVLPLLQPDNQYTVKFKNSMTLLSPGYNLKNLSRNMSARQESLSDSSLCRVNITACSKDGTKVPITLFHKKGLHLNGRHPVLVHVYGSYGINVNMDFSPEKFHLLIDGWVLAFCHVRGGGELGRRWYHMARKKRKNRTFEDFEACVRAIHQRGYSSSHLTAVVGRSAGGLPVAVLCNRTPHLVKAAVLKVPFLDLMTSMLDESLPLTAQEYEEFGNPRLDVNDFDELKSFCPYTNISKQDYPSMLFMSSVNDVRVPYWMSLKFVSKLRFINSMKAYTSSQRMILLKTDFESGHFGQGTFNESAFIYAFLYKALGLPLR